MGIRCGRRFFTFMIVLALAVGCQTTPKSVPAPSEALVPIAWEELPALPDDDDAATLAAAVSQSLAWAERQPGDRVFAYGPARYTAADLRDALRDVAEALQSAPGPAPLREILARRFDLYAYRGERTARVMATGYFVPMVEGSLTADPAYPVPVYGVPPDLITVRLSDFSDEWAGKSLRGRVVGRQLMPYWTRKEIRGRGEPLAPPLAWVKDEFDLFVVEIQGSGILRTADGQERIIAYAEQNGHPYRPVGRLLLDEGKVAKGKMSLKAIRDYVTAHPDDRGRVLEYNPSMVFFRMADKGVVGNLNVPLTPGRSVATDQKFVPPGVPLWLRVDRPAASEAGDVTSDGHISRVVLSQDTGGAIRGAGRLDLFWGSGAKAEEMASLMQHEGEAYLMLPKAGLAPVARGKSAKGRKKAM